MSKMDLMPEFANVAFNLKDNKKVSQIVQTEYGYHIIQLIEKRGDRINCRHILLKPKVSDKELSETTVKMDSLYNDIAREKFTFEDATIISADKDTRNNKGVMVNSNMQSSHYGTPKFEMAELPQEVGKIVYNMKVGDISKPFRMITNTQKDVVAIVKLKARVEQHKANISDDYQELKSLVENQKREELLNDWIRKKQKTTYVRISDNWKNCEFRFPGWIKE
jgi:peptidyl-prolyl cis-trans isomerase SurA